MSKYLFVAHEAATSPKVSSKLDEIAAADPEAEFLLVVPATPVQHLLAWEEGETQEIARRRAAAGRALLEERGHRLVDVVVGDPEPLTAIEDELRERGHEFAAIIIATPPPTPDPLAEDGRAVPGAGALSARHDPRGG